MTNFTIPDQIKPVGRIEWAGNSNFLYGIDRIGQVFRFEDVRRTAPKPSFTSRFKDIIGFK